MSSTTLKLPHPCSRDRLHVYQERAVQFIKDTPSCALWVDMGLGKTVTVLTALADLRESFKTHRVLVIAPLRVAAHTWPDEIGKWEHTEHLTFKRIAGSKAAREELITNDSSIIHIINRELIPWLVETLKSRWPYDTVVIDEASSFKSPSSKRFKALRKMLPNIARLIQLTGTPAPNGLLDVWSQIFLLDKGQRLGRSYTQYKQRYFLSDYMGYSWALRKGADKLIHQEINDLCLTLAANDYLDLPARIDRNIEVQMPGEAATLYRQLERDFLLEFDDDEVLEVLSAAAMCNKLLQFSNGAFYVGDKGEFKTAHSAKLDALADLIDEAAGRPVLVAYNYKSDAVRICERFPQAETFGSDPTLFKRWNNSEVPLMLAHPASAGHGLNFQAGGNIIVWFGLNWSLELYQQFNARLHRQGQQKPVIINHIVTTDTVDEVVLAALANKNHTQSQLLLALKGDVTRRIRGRE